MQDVLACLLLSEAIYKAAEGPPSAATAALNALLADLRAALPHAAPTPQLSGVQFSRRGTQHRYLIARGKDALYLSFMGSKQPRDLLADANLLTALGVPVEALFMHARRQGLRLVLCGHSMGGAVAQLCTLRLLRTLRSPPPAEQLRCIAFGAPAIGNAALAGHVQQQGWGAHFMSIALPEDPVPRLLQQVPPSQQGLAPQHQPPSPSTAAEAAASLQSLDAEPEGEQDTKGSQPSSSSAAAASKDGQRTEGASTPAAAAGGWRPAAAAAALARRPLTAAGGVARSAARTALAGASMLRPPSVLPAFSHIGQLLLLLPGGLVPAFGSLLAPQSGLGSNGGPQTQPLPAQQWRQLHSMAHYRARAVTLCWQQVQQQQEQQQQQQRQEQLPDEQQHRGQLEHQPGQHGQLDQQQGRQQAQQQWQLGHQGSDPGPAQEPGVLPEVALSRSLAPAVLVRHAVAPLPVVQLPPAQAQRQAVQLTVEVRGSGLECCSGAALRLPGTAAPVSATAITNLARQRLLADLQAAAGGSSAGSTGGAASWLRAAAERGWAGVQHWREPQQLLGEAGQELPGLLLQFSVPAAAISMLQLQQRQWSPHADASAGQQQQHEGAARLLPPARLVLLNDFGRVAATAQLQPRVAWLLGLDGSLSADTLERLQAAAATPAPEPSLGGGWRRRLPGARLAGGVPWSSMAAAAPAAGDAVAEGQQESAQQQQQQAQQEQAGGPADAPPRFAAPAAQRLRRLGEQIAAHLPGRSGAAEHGPALPAALLRGVLLLDGSAVLAESGGSSMEERLEAATEALQWLAKQHGNTAPGSDAGSMGSGGNSAAALAQAGSEPEMEEVDDEYLAELRQLGLAAQLRRQLVQAARVAAAKRRTLGRRRRHAVALLRAAPPPDAVLLVLRHGDLLSTQFGEGLDAAALGAVRRLAAACRACRPAAAPAAAGGPVPLLLAVASRGPLSAPYRYELAAGTGLTDASMDSSSGGGGSSRYGSVVPLPLQQRQPGSVGGAGSSTGGAGLPGGASTSGPHVDVLLAALLSYVGQPWTGLAARL
ncbi:hypothetical protein ABPG75_003876 [Micractinium tetrahymenae]